QLEVPPAKAGVVGTWLRDLSDGYMSFRLDGSKDFDAGRMPGPFVVKDVKKKNVASGAKHALPKHGVEKPWFIGIEIPPRVGHGDGLEDEKASKAGKAKGDGSSPMPEPVSFTWADPGDAPLKFTRLHEVHKALGGRMVPFAGWEMPVVYTGIYEE